MAAGDSIKDWKKLKVGQTVDLENGATGEIFTAKIVKIDHKLITFKKPASGRTLEIDMDEWYLDGGAVYEVF